MAQFFVVKKDDELNERKLVQHRVGSIVVSLPNATSLSNATAMDSVAAAMDLCNAIVSSSHCYRARENGRTLAR